MSLDPSARRLGRTTIILCFLVAMIEGFDTQSAGVAAPKLAAALGLEPNALGLFFTASTVGMFLGAFIGGRMADRFGRKPVLLASVALFGVFSVLTGLSAAMTPLLATRLLTGLGLGAAMPALISLAAENNPTRHARAVAMMYAGLPLGGAVAGVASVAFSDWQVIFHVGGALPLLALPALAIGLTESRHSPPATLAEPRTGALAALLGPGRAVRTLTLWLAFFSAMLVLYLMLNWTPVLLSSRGFPKPQIALFQATLNVVGALGVLIAAPLLDDKRRIWLAAGAYLTTIVSLALVAWMPPQMALVLLIASALGGGLLTSQSILYASAPALYDAGVRGAGVGSAVAVGRMGSIVGPLLAGVVLSLGVSPAALIALTIPIFMIAAFANLAVLRGAAGSRTLGG